MSGDLYEDDDPKPTKLGKHLAMCKKFLEVCFDGATQSEADALRMLTAMASALAVELSDVKLRKEIGMIAPAKAKKDFRPVNPLPKRKRVRKAVKKAPKGA